MELRVDWEKLKSVYDSNKNYSLRYIDLIEWYHVWLEMPGITLFCPNVSITGEFNDDYKALCKNSTANPNRIVTNKLGGMLCFHYIEFTTSDLDSIDNEDVNGVDDGSISLKLFDANGDETIVENEAVQTVIDFSPEFTYEIAGGDLLIPATLDGANDDAWEVFVMAAPGIIDHQFLRHVHLSWFKGNKIEMDASLNPAEMPYIAETNINTIRVIIKHPAGAKSKFCMVYRYFK